MRSGVGRARQHADFQPVVAATAGWLIFGETLSVMELFGGAMVAAALVLIRLPSRRAAPI